RAARPIATPAPVRRPRRAGSEEGATPIATARSCRRFVHTGLNVRLRGDNRPGTGQFAPPGYAVSWNVLEPLVPARCAAELRQNAPQPGRCGLFVPASGSSLPGPHSRTAANKGRQKEPKASGATVGLPPHLPPATEAQAAPYRSLQ